MYKIISFVALLLILTQCNNPQSEIKKKIVGTWVLEDMFINERSAAAQVVGQPQYQFHDDGKYYSFHAGQKEIGSWKLSEDSTLTLESETYDDKEPLVCRITVISDQQFRYKSKKGKWRVEMHLTRF
ncbi:MAG: hypothetical protein HKN92_09505 [Chitinophagales bacterium]|nr:hypothetical protein [Chitinophagales bacterium]